MENVHEEGLSGSPDEALYRACIREKRTPVTLDIDLSNPFRFPPEATEGILVVRPQRPVLPQIFSTLMNAMAE